MDEDGPPTDAGRL